MERLTSQGVRNLDCIRIERPIIACDGQTTCMPTKWRTEGIYPNIAMERLDDPDPAWQAGNVEIRTCRCCLRVMDERNRKYDLPKVQGGSL